MKNLLGTLLLSSVVIAHGATIITPKSSPLSVNSGGTIVAPLVAKTNTIFPGTVTAATFVGDGSGMSNMPSTGLQPASANLTNWSSLATSSVQPASANLTNWSSTTTASKQDAITASSVVTANSFAGKTLPPIKASFSTNYTATTNDAVLFCTGTNQLITMPDCTVASTAFMLTVVTATTTGSVIVTNANGSQKLLGLASVTNAAATRVTLINDGANYW